MFAKFIDMVSEERTVVKAPFPKRIRWLPELLSDGRTLVVYDDEKYSTRRLTRILQHYPNIKIDPSQLRLAPYREMPDRLREYIFLDNPLRNINVRAEDLLEDKIEIKRLTVLVNEALTLLPDQRREILDFAFGLEGHPKIPLAEIAEHLHISIDRANKELDAAKKTVGGIVAFHLNHSENALPDSR
jgi:hypothetical protein